MIQEPRRPLDDVLMMLADHWDKEANELAGQYYDEETDQWDDETAATEAPIYANCASDLRKAIRDWLNSR